MERKIIKHERTRKHDFSVEGPSVHRQVHRINRRVNEVIGQKNHLSLMLAKLFNKF